MADNVVDIIMKLSVDDADVKAQLDNFKNMFKGMNTKPVSKQLEKVNEQILEIKASANAAQEAMTALDNSRGKVKSKAVNAEIEERITALKELSNAISHNYEKLSKLDKNAGLGEPGKIQEEQAENFQKILDLDARTQAIDERRLALAKEMQAVTAQLSQKQLSTAKQIESGQFKGNPKQSKKISDYLDSKKAIDQETAALNRESREIRSQVEELGRRNTLLSNLSHDEAKREEFVGAAVDKQSEITVELEKQDAEMDTINQEIGEIIEKAGILPSTVSGVTEAVRQTGSAAKAVLTEEQKLTRANLASARSRASSNYYVLRALKMLSQQVDGTYEGIKRLDKAFVDFGSRALKAISKLAFGFGLLHRKSKEASKSHDGFVGSLKSGFTTLLKYTLGIRSIYFLINKLRRALVDGMGNLAMASSHVNEQMSAITSNLSWMKNMMAVAAQPLLNVLVPAINTVANAFERATHAIASFFATLTGQNFVYKAVKPMEDYAASLDKASGSAKKLNQNLLGIDELNVINDDKGGGGGAGGNQFETAEIETTYSKLADKVKDILSTLFDPIKKAWDTEGKFVMDSWKFALEEVSLLIKSIGRDFLEVWSNDTGVKIWENIFHIVGDVGLIVGNLARNFRLAWEEGDKGKRILEGIQSLIAIIVQGIRDMADWTVEWAKSLNFNPLLEETIRLLDALKQPVKFIVDTFTAFWEKVLMPFRKYVIEEGLPLLMRQIQEIINLIDWSKLTQNMNNLMDAVGTLLPKAFEALVIVLGDLGKSFADIINSDNIGKLIERFKDWANNVRPEDLAKELKRLIKVLGGLTIGLKAAKAILKLAIAWKTFRNVFLQADVLKAIKKVAAANEAATDSIGASGLRGAVTKLTTAVATYNKSGKTFPQMIADIGIYAKDSAVKLVTFFKTFSASGAATQGLTALKAGFEGLRATLGPIGTGIAGILGGLAQFKTYSSAFENITKGAAGFNDILKLIIGTAAGLGGLSLMLGFPAGPIAAGVIGLIGAFKGMKDAMEEVNEVNLTESLTAEVEGASFTLNDLEQTIKANVDAITSHVSELSAQLSEVGSREDTFENLRSDVLGLATAMEHQGNVTEKEMQDLENSINDLKTAWEEYIDSQYDYAIKSAISNMQLISSQRELTDAEKEEFGKRIEALYGERDANIESMEASIEEIKKLQESLANGTISYEEFGQGILDVYNNSAYLKDTASDTKDFVEGVSESLDEFNGALDLSGEGIKNTADYIDTFATSMQSNYSAIKDADTQLTDAITENIAKREQAEKDGNDALASQMDANVAMYNSQKEELDRITAGYADVLQENIANQGKRVIEDAIADYESMNFGQKFALSTTQGIENEAEYAKAQFESFANDVILGEGGLVGKMNTELQLAPDELWIDEFATTMADKLFDSVDISMGQNGAAYSTILAGNWKTTFDSALAELKPDDIGRDISKGLYDGVGKQIVENRGDYLTTFNYIEDYAREATKTHSPSEKFFLVGVDIVAGLKDGIVDTVNSYKDEITSTFGSIVTDVSTYFETLSTATNSIVTTMTTTIHNAFKTLHSSIITETTLFKGTLTTSYNDLQTKIIRTITTFKKDFETLYKHLKENILTETRTFSKRMTDLFTLLRATLGTIVKAFADETRATVLLLNTNLINSFTVMKDTVIGVFTAMRLGIKDEMNIILSLVEGMANKIADGFNSVADEIKDITTFDWTNPMTGETFHSDGLSLPKMSHISIPRLAQGAVIPPNKEFLAVLGDQKSGTNIEAPIETIQDAVALVLQPYLEQLISITQDIYEKDTDLYIGDVEIARANNRGQRRLGATLRKS